MGLEFVDSAVTQYAPSLRPDDHSKWIRRFFAPELDDIPQLKQAAPGWTSSNRLVLFEFKYTKNDLTLLLGVGPGQEGEEVEQIRRRLLDCAKKSGPPFIMTSRYGKHLFSIYWKAVLSSQDYMPFDPENAKTKVETSIAGFYENDYWPMVNAIRQKFGLSPVS